MARWSSGVPSWTTGTGTGDTANLTDNQHHTLQGGTSTCRYEMREIFMGGLSTSSAPAIMVFGRTSTVGATLTTARLAAADPATAALSSAPQPYVASTTKPQRSSTLGILLNLSFNSFGGVVRWVNGPDEIFSLLGNTASLGELSLNAYTGSTSGTISSHLIFETL